MPDNLCPMCSNPNEEGAEICAHCGARLTPLVLDSSAEDSTADMFDASSIGDRISPPDEPVEEELPDWLGRIRAEAEVERTPEEGEPEPPAEGEQPDWLGRMREVEMTSEEGPPEGEVPDWVTDFSDEPAEPEQDQEQAPDWLERIRAREAQEQETPPETTPVEEDWLQRLRGAEEPPEEHDAPEMGVVEESAEDVDESQLPEDEFGVRSYGEVFKEGESGEWSELDLASLLEEAEGEEEAPSAPMEPPPWLSAEGLQVDALEAAGEEELEVEELADVEDAGLDLDQEGLEEEGALPRVQPLIMEEGAAQEEFDSAELDLDSIDLPEWLTDLEGAPQAPQAPESPRDADLAPATLPAWLEAMRPIETFRSTVEIESADEQFVESAGPLAGLRGVLVAEPVVAIPRTGGVGSARLEVTERQYAQSELLHRLVEQDARESQVAPAASPGPPLLRWLISAVLVLAVSLPVFIPGFAGGFPLPSLVPQDLAPLVSRVESLPADRPVLVVFDYNPGFSGELDAVAGSLLRHVFGRGLQVASLSTLPTGPPLAEGLLSRYGVNGVNYIHLGYLSGGPTAVQVFAAAPREAIPRGFLPPEEPGQEIHSGWDAPMLQRVRQLSDFGMVVVITAGTESARTWAEQATPWMGDAPLVMVLSAGAEPLVRPYYEALDPQVDGLLTGIPAAVAYEQLNVAPGYAQARWDSFGMGMLAAVSLLLAGAIVSVVNWLLRPDAG